MLQEQKKNTNIKNLKNKDENLKDDQQKKYNSDDSNLSVEILNNFFITKSREKILTDERLQQIENPIIVEKIS